MLTTVQAASPKVELKPIKPMAWLESVLLFGIPAVALFASMWWLRPALMSAGVDANRAYVVALSLVNVGLVVATVIGYRREGQPWTWGALSQRLRLTHLTGKTWLWTLGGTLLFGGLALAVNSIALTIYKAISFTMPEFTAGPLTLGQQIIVLFFNIVGEELWWRGFILPRQELTHGTATWFIHGALWACFHMFKWWAVPFMLITCPIIPFVAQKTKNTWPGMINHLIINGASALMAAF